MHECREVMLNRMRHLRAEIAQLFTDTESWNDLHPEEKPIDPDGQLACIAAALDTSLAKEEAE